MTTFADLVLSSDALAVVTAVVAAVAAATGLLFRTLMRWRDDQIADLRRQRDDLLRVVYRHGLADHVPESVPHSALPPTPPPRE